LQNLIDFVKSFVEIIIIYYGVGTAAVIKKVVSGIRTPVIKAFVASTVMTAYSKKIK
jgi:hypothetical protein